MLTKVREFVRAKAAKLIDDIKRKRRERRLTKMSPDLFCSVCKQPIKRDEFIALVGQKQTSSCSLLGQPRQVVRVAAGHKKYCEACFNKEFKK